MTPSSAKLNTSKATDLYQFALGICHGHERIGR